MSDAPDPAVRHLLRRRADALRAVLPEPRDEERLVWAAVCSVGDGSVAFLLSALKGVVPLAMVTPVPLAGPSVVGVTRFQGQLVTVLSLASLLGRAWATDPTSLIVLDARGASIAVDCTVVPRTVALAPEAVASAREAPTWMAPVRSVDGELVQLIDVPRLVQTEVVRGGR
jgi:chemotaxis signal transduction protein